MFSSVTHSPALLPSSLSSPSSCGSAPASPASCVSRASCSSSDRGMLPPSASDGAIRAVWSGGVMVFASSCGRASSADFASSSARCPSPFRAPTLAPLVRRPRATAQPSSPCASSSAAGCCTPPPESAQVVAGARCGPQSKGTARPSLRVSSAAGRSLRDKCASRCSRTVSAIKSRSFVDKKPKSPVAFENCFAKAMSSGRGSRTFSSTGSVCRRALACSSRTSA
mmetsp:Transcript_56286/g.131995  ORF Transcript_56286/g.131995 Transcript_56286/m.131995 type:complete len:225 (+) Transcript_56286:713-1387(+)